MEDLLLGGRRGEGRRGKQGSGPESSEDLWILSVCNKEITMHICLGDYSTT